MSGSHAGPRDEPHWEPGDAFGLPVPADPAALRTGGTGWLTGAFRAFGALAPDNAVTAITQCEECPGGSTGRKLLLAVEYAHPGPGLPRELFVKFSRDLDDPIRDRGRTQMELEVRFAALSHVPDFPIRVPACLFADYHAASGTGVLVTERLEFGRNGVEPHHPKCLDYEVPDALGHYEVLVTALARLAGADKGGRLPAAFAQAFPFEPEKLGVGVPTPYSAEQLGRRAQRFGEFARRHPGLVPANVRDEAFLARFAAEAPRFAGQGSRIEALLASRPELVALCHWNANIDNAWFWREGDGSLACGLLDWGCVSQMNVAMALWGSMSGAETSLWDDHLGALLARFAREYRAAGGPDLDLAELRLHLMLNVANMGLTWLMNSPPHIQRLIPDLDNVADRFDPRVADCEAARTQLQMLCNFTSLWQRQDFGACLDALLARDGAVA